MVNPYTTPLFIVGMAAGILAACVVGRGLVRHIARASIIMIGSVVCGYIWVLIVDWNYNNPFNPNDGGPKTFAALFGWLLAIVWPIGPTFVAAIIIRKVFSLYICKCLLSGSTMK